MRICVLHTKQGINYETDLIKIRSLTSDVHKVLFVVNDTEKDFILEDDSGISIRNIQHEAFKVSKETEWLKSRFEDTRNNAKRGILNFIDELINTLELTNLFRHYRETSDFSHSAKKYEQTLTIKHLLKVRNFLYSAINFSKINRGKLLKSILKNSRIIRIFEFRNSSQIMKLENSIDNRVFFERAAFVLRAFHPDYVLYSDKDGQRIVQSVEIHLNQAQYIDLRDTPLEKSMFVEVENEAI